MTYIVHNNSKEEFSVSIPHPYKHNSQYGYLVLLYNNKVIFFTKDEDSTHYEDVSKEFTVYNKTY